MPGPGDRVCSCHFISGEKFNIPISPDYVPTVSDSECTKDFEDASLARFERAQRRSNRQHLRHEHHGEESHDLDHPAIQPDLTGV